MLRGSETEPVSERGRERENERMLAKKCQAFGEISQDMISFLVPEGPKKRNEGPSFASLLSLPAKAKKNHLEKQHKAGFNDLIIFFRECVPALYFIDRRGGCAAHLTSIQVGFD